MCEICQALGRSEHDEPLAFATGTDGGSTQPSAASGTYASATGNPEIDGLLSGYAWAGGAVTYSFPDAAADYPVGYGYGEPTASGFAQVSAAQQLAVNAILARVAAVTNLSITYAGTGSADIRIAQSSEANPTAYAYYPGSNAGGDVWFGTQYNYRSPNIGDYYYLTHIHELGHALGLKHSQETGGVANVAVPSGHDALEFTVMSYRSYVGGPTTGYTNEQFGYPTTFMMNDILALQTMYGADYAFNAGDTLYSWSTSTGETFVDGVGQGQPGANRIFLTIWDGGGIDTYDMSNYSGAVRIDLNPGSYSITASGQRAYLGAGNYAHGNVYNAYLFNGDGRSYIENAIGGAGGDTILGNATANVIDARAGSDVLTGGAGDDLFVYSAGYGADAITDFAAGGSQDRIDLSGLAGVATFEDVMARGVQSGSNAVFSFGTGSTLTLRNVSLVNLTAADFIFGADRTSERIVVGVTIKGTQAADLIDGTQSIAGQALPTNANDTISGSDGNDTLHGLDGADLVAGDKGNDVVCGDAGDDILSGAAGTDRLYGGEGNDTFRLSGNADQGDIVDGGLGTDTIVISGTKAVTLAGFDAGAASIEVWQGNGAAAIGTDAGNAFDLGGLSALSGMSYLDAGGGDDNIVGSDFVDALRGGSGNDMIAGGRGGDTLTGGSGIDSLSGGDGDDVFVVSGTGDVADIFAGGAGTDAIRVTGSGSATLAGLDTAASSIETWIGNNRALLGTAYADTFDFRALTSVSGLPYVDAAGGNDVLIGSVLAEMLRGGAGDDRIAGGRGDDSLSGGTGNDIFTFAPGFGHDVIHDFIAGAAAGDAIEFDRSVFADYGEVTAAAQQMGGDVVITDASGDSVTLVGVSLAQLTEGDFLFV